MNNNDFKYFTGRTETPNHENINNQNQNKKNLEVNHSKKSNYGASNIFRYTRCLQSIWFNSS